MAVVVPKQRVCPRCHDTLAYTSKDVRIIEQKQPTTYHTNGNAIQKILVNSQWYVTCPTCKKYFLAEEFTRFE